MKHFLLILLVLATIPHITAIGISPPSADITFAPGYEGEFDIILRNSRPIAVQTEVTIGGTLGQYFTATTPDVRARSTATSTISFSLPEDIPPGTNTVSITYRESFFDPNEGTFSARTAVVFQARVWKPYPGQFAEIAVKPKHVPAGRNTDAEIVVRSRGDQPIRGDVQVRIYDASGRLVDSEVFSNVNIEGDSTWRRFAYIGSQDYPPGRYLVSARYDYGAGVAEDEATLIIGVRDIDLLDITRDFYLDVPVNPFSVDVESLWNEHIEGVEASVQLGANTGRTPSINLASFTKKSLDGFWTTDRALEPGTYNALVTVNFRDGEPVTRSFPVTVHAETPRPPQEEEPAAFIVLGIIDIVFLLVVLALIAFVGMRVFGHHKGEKIEV